MIFHLHRKKPQTFNFLEVNHLNPKTRKNNRVKPLKPENKMTTQRVETSKENRKIEVVATDFVYLVFFVLVTTTLLKVKILGLASGCVCWYLLPSGFLQPAQYQRIIETFRSCPFSESNSSPARGAKSR